MVVVDLVADVIVVAFLVVEIANNDTVADIDVEFWVGVPGCGLCEGEANIFVAGVTHGGFEAQDVDVVIAPELVHAGLCVVHGLL